MQYAVDGDDLVVLPGHPESKQGWRNLRGGAVVMVLINGARRDGRGRVMWAEDPAYPRSLLAYRRRFPRAPIPLGAPLVRIELEPAP